MHSQDAEYPSPPSSAWSPKACLPTSIDDFPYLEREDIAEALRYAAEAVRERQLPLVADG